MNAAQEEKRKDDSQTKVNLEFIEKYNTIKKEFSELFAEKFFLENTYQQNLEAYYLSELGLLRLDFEKKEYEVEFLRRKIDVIQNTPNAIAFYKLDIVDENVKSSLKEKEEFIKAFEEKIRASNSRLVNLLSTEESEEIHKIFPDIVAYLYPQIQIEQSDYLNELWEEVVTLFLNGKTKEIKKIYSTFDFSVKNNDLSPQELQTEISCIQEKIADLHKEIKEIKKSFPFTLIPVLTDTNLLADEVAKYSDGINELTKQKHRLENKLSGLTAIYDYGSINPN